MKLIFLVYYCFETLSLISRSFFLFITHSCNCQVELLRFGNSFQPKVFIKKCSKFTQEKQIYIKFSFPICNLFFKVIKCFFKGFSSFWRSLTWLLFEFIFFLDLLFISSIVFLYLHVKNYFVQQCLNIKPKKWSWQTRPPYIIRVVIILYASRFIPFIQSKFLFI